MKKKLAALLLGTVLGISTVCQAGAAALEESDEASQLFGDAFTSDAPEVLPPGPLEEVTPPEQDGFGDGDEVFPQGDLFTAGEVPGVTATPTPEPSQAPLLDLDEGEMQEAQKVLEPGTVIMAQWRREENGRWRLVKSLDKPQEPEPQPTVTPSPGPTQELLNQGFLEPGEVPILELTPAPEREISYYNATDGIVHIRTLQSLSSQTLVTEGDYLFDEEGYLFTGAKTVEPGLPGFELATAEELFFMDEANAQLLIPENVLPAPFNSNLGQMQKGWWLWTGESFRYYSSEGPYLSMEKLRQINEEKGSYTGGLYKIRSVTYCLDDAGVPREGFYEITQGTRTGLYYFLTSAESGEAIAGAMLQGGWRSRTIERKIQWCYFGRDGKRKSLGIVARKLDPAVTGDDLYLLDEEGFLIRDTMVQASNSNWYMSDSQGRVIRSRLVKYNGARYYFGPSGKLSGWKNSWHLVRGDSDYYYYFGSTPGVVEEKQGWQLVRKPNGKVVGWFYFAANGNHYKDLLAKNGCYLDPTGKLAAGIHTVNGRTYFFQSSTAQERRGVMYKNTWIHSRNKWYYAGGDGVLFQNTWRDVEGSSYYFQGDCSVLTNSTAVRDGVKGYVDSRGRFTTGWVVVSNANNLVKYVDPATGTFAANRSVIIDGMQYWFDSDGYRINDVSDRVPGPYYLEADRVNGVMTVFNADRTIPVKTIRISVGLPGTPTPVGRYGLTRGGRWQALIGPAWGQYATHVDGAGYGGIFIHTVPCTYANSYNLPAAEYNKLGNPASHGCIRCCVGDCKWVYDNCNGGRIYIFDGTCEANEVFKGPLGRMPITPLRGSGNFDPTDPAV